jgi:hypothetical protein
VTNDENCRRERMEGTERVMTAIGVWCTFLGSGMQWEFRGQGSNKVLAQHRLQSSFRPSVAALAAAGFRR